jgi:hypothetical protein
MKKLFILFSLCLLGVSCNLNSNPTQNAEIILKKPEVINQVISKATTSEQFIKKLVTPSPKPTESFIAPSSTPTLVEAVPKSFVNMKIITPNGESNFTVELKDNQTACDNLVESKAEGKIISVTLKDTYLDSLGSLYVYEINGYKNNWVFYLNGKGSSTGCSKVFPKNGDTVEWKFD